MAEQDSSETNEDDRGWRSLERSADETWAFIAIAVLVALIALVGLTAGLSGLIVVFLPATFAMIAVLILISRGK